MVDQISVATTPETGMPIGGSQQAAMPPHAQAAVAQRLEAVGEMAVGIAHDFRNVLTVIDAGLRLAEQHADDPDQARHFIAGARGGLERGLSLISQLLMFARQQELEAKTADAGELLRELELFLKYGAGPGLRVVLDLSSDIPKCRVDRAGFTAAILNLLLNARDATPHGGLVVISAHRYVAADAMHDLAKGNYLRVRVRDSGQGMSPETLEHVFEPFFTTKGDHGTGLGLPQVSSFIRAAGGHLVVASARGVGTTFDLLFPVDRPADR